MSFAYSGDLFIWGGGGAVCRATHLYSRAAFRDAVLCLGCVLPGCPVAKYVYGSVLWSAPPPLVTDFSTVIILFSYIGWPWSIRSNLFINYFLTVAQHGKTTLFISHITFVKRLSHEILPPISGFYIFLAVKKLSYLISY